MVAAALVPLLFAGCGAEQSAGSDDPGSSSAAHNSSPPSSAPASPSRTQAPGKPAAIGHASITVPTNWTVDPGSDQSVTFNDNKRSMACEIGETGGWSGETRSKKNITEIAKEALADYPSNWRRLPDLVVNGVRLYHIRGTEAGHWNDEYGTVGHGFYITVGFDHDTVFAPRTWQIKQMTKVMKTFRLR